MAINHYDDILDGFLDLILADIDAPRNYGQKSSKNGPQAKDDQFIDPAKKTPISSKNPPSSGRPETTNTSTFLTVEIPDDLTPDSISKSRVIVPDVSRINDNETLEAYASALITAAGKLVEKSYNLPEHIATLPMLKAVLDTISTVQILRDKKE